MRKSIAILASLATLWLALPAAAAAPTVALGSSVLEIAAGQTEPLSVTVADVQDLYGLEIHLRFDPAVVQVADADPESDGIQVVAGDFLSADFVAQNRADNQGGTVDYAVTQVNPNEPKSGGGTLLVIRFQGGAAGGASQLEVTNGILTTRDGDLIPATFASGEVRVKAASPGQNPATSTPTSERPAATPTATTIPRSSSGGDAPTATRAFTNTPPAAVPERSPTPRPSIPAAATSEPSPDVALAATSEPSPSLVPAATSTALVGASQMVATVQPTLAAVETSQDSLTATADAPTPALVAKASSSGAGKSILETGAAPEPRASEKELTQSGQPVVSGLLVGGSVLLGLALLGAAALIWLVLRRRHA
jgi:hypothetical protein